MFSADAVLPTTPLLLVAIVLPIWKPDKGRDKLIALTSKHKHLIMYFASHTAHLPQKFHNSKLVIFELLV
jgi:hypothetical protein